MIEVVRNGRLRCMVDSDALRMWSSTTQLTRLSDTVLLIELYIRTRGRTGDAACTNTTGPQGDTRAILHAVEYEVHIGVRVYGALYVMLMCQLRKWPQKHAVRCLFLST